MRLSLFRLISPVLPVIVLVFPAQELTQTAAVAHTGPDSGLVVLAGSVPPASVLSQMATKTRVEGELTVSLQLKVRDRPGLDRFLHALYDPSSAAFHHFLTPREFARRFAPTGAVRSAALAWLRGERLHGIAISTNGMQITATGKAGTVASAFRTRLARVRMGSSFANVEPVQIPAWLARTVESVDGLSNVQLWNHPRVGFHLTGAKLPAGFGPGELARLYDVNPLRKRGLDGAGQTIAVVSFADFDPRDIDTYDRKFGMTGSVTRVAVSDGESIGAPLGDEQDEAEADVEVLQGGAPGASIVMYEAPNDEQGTIAMYQKILSDDSAQVISTSWGAWEGAFSHAEISTMDQLLAEAAAQGQTVLAASGDSGAFDAAAYGDPRTEKRLEVDFPASDPWVTGVGGTALQTSAGRYEKETGWSEPATRVPPTGSGGGLSTVFRRPSYQVGKGIHNKHSTGMRQVPDVAAEAELKTGYAIYTVDPLSGQPEWGQFGGTSAAAPFWAGFAATLDQAAGRRLGALNPLLYTLGKQAASYPRSPFHDVLSGTNLYFHATPGWDYVTGWGSFDGAALVADARLTDM